jgi:hypothetical protein
MSRDRIVLSSALVASAAAAAVFVGVVFPVAVGASAGSKDTVTTAQSEASAIKDVHWTTNVSTALSAGSWTFRSTGLPASSFVASSYAVPADPFNVSATGASIVQSASVLKDQSYDYTIPLTPAYSETVTATNLGPIGFLLDGAALYNPYEANKTTVATSDNFIASSNGSTASFIDTCDGHPGPGGQYHYHGLATCLVSYATGGKFTVSSITSSAGATTPGVTESTKASKRPVILGFAFDGYGIYDNVSMGGSTIPVSSLDACNGIFSAVPGYPHGIYHYVLENVKGARSSIGCYHGVVSSAYTAALHGAVSSMTGGGSGGPPPQGAPVSTKTGPAVATAYSLAANKGTDAFLMAELKTLGYNASC